MNHMHIDREMLKDSVLLITSLRSSTCPLPAFIYAIPSPPTINSLILIRLDSYTHVQTHTWHTHRLFTDQNWIKEHNQPGQMNKQNTTNFCQQMLLEFFSELTSLFWDFFNNLCQCDFLVDLWSQHLLPFMSQHRIVTSQVFGTVFVDIIFLKLQRY